MLIDSGAIRILGLTADEAWIESLVDHVWTAIAASATHAPPGSVRGPVATSRGAAMHRNFPQMTSR
jgi:hypothetical protein